MGCRSVLSTLRDEFRRKNFGFGGVKPERFYTFQWRLPPILYILYRLFLAVYTLTWLIITTGVVDQSNPKWGVFFTNWTYTALTTYLLTHCVATLLYYGFRLRHGESLLKRSNKVAHVMYFVERVNISDSRGGCDIEMAARNGKALPSNGSSNHVESAVDKHRELPVFFVIIQTIVWWMFIIVSTSALLVTIIFWAILFPVVKGGKVSHYDVQLHILNAVIIIIENTVTAIPVRLLHAIYPVIYASIYCLFTLIYWTGDHSRVIYPILNWNQPGIAVGCILGVGFVVMPLLHSFYYLIYKLKLRIHDKLYE